MQLTLEGGERANRIQALGEEGVRINGTLYARSVVVTAAEIRADWPVDDVAGIEDRHWEALLAAAPEIVLLGTGAVIAFPEPRQLAPLTRAGIGVEVMDSAAACRTFNVLLNEGRAVALALILNS